MIRRRSALKLIAAAPAFLRARSVSRPNLLMIMSDQQRGDSIGAENPTLDTPNLDRIAREGIRFRHAYSSTPTCTPARAALLTGLSPWRHGMLGYSRVPEKYPVEKPRILGEAGYFTCGIGKMHWTPQRNTHGFHQMLLDESGRAESPHFRSDYRAWFASQAPLLNPDATGIGWNDYRGGEYRLPEYLHPTRWTGDCATRFLADYDRPNPFFLKVSFARPHSPYDPPARLLKRYQQRSLPEPVVGSWAGRYEPRSGPKDDIWHGRMPAEEIRLARAAYAGSITFIDEQIGRILETLEKRRMLDETLILFFSDHGDMTGDHHLWRKSYAYEASARIPMLVRGPGAPAGLVDLTPVELRDVLPTFLHAAEKQAPIPLDGQNLLTVKRPWIDLEHDVCYSPANHWNALTDGRHKYIYHAQQGEEQLFDLATDPNELNDLSGHAAHEPALRLWRSRMIEHLAERGEKWVSSGRLVPRPQSILHSPHYPKPQ
jgi:arylsulfatase A-like enzyme